MSNYAKFKLYQIYGLQLINHYIVNYFMRCFGRKREVVRQNKFTTAPKHGLLEKICFVLLMKSLEFSAWSMDFSFKRLLSKYSSSSH